ncbi:hypothetical protein Poli38472_011019 [Pythium oligandrum]|uniref:FAR1 domain-containing protein n=1 Tax=Pythium oligandrum TaxID=41045 RepID=A0A8K1CQI6_PYTOL|nr:hypothetical protein Poli38472_011019 [Pythium oligandrum]|eukprot:TMW67399.1 hypothetical protein Poli38472_011019 [Pythium oligandrum]
MRAIRQRLLDAQRDADVSDASASDAAVQQHVVERRGRFDDENDEEPLRNGRRVRGKRAAQIAVCSSSVTRMVPRVEPRHFDSWNQFNQVWCEYLAANFLCYRTRSSHSTPRWNEKTKKAYKVPESFEWAEKTMWCTHGCIQESRGTGKRKRGQIRFTGCPARVHFMVTPRNVDGVVQWKIRCVREIVVHNHNLSEDIFASYMSNSVVTDEQLFGPSENAQQEGNVVHPVEDTHSTFSNVHSTANKDAYCV